MRKRAARERERQTPAAVHSPLQPPSTRLLMQSLADEASVSRCVRVCVPCWRVIGAHSVCVSQQQQQQSLVTCLSRSREALPLHKHRRDGGSITDVSVCVCRWRSDGVSVSWERARVNDAPSCTGE